jgi:MFS family permease
MILPVRLRSALVRRLLPLYVAAFFQGFVLWYAVEKLFMTGIGFDEAGIGLMIAIYSAVMILVETPSGILADRWSRKGVLILASLALIASSLVAGWSQSMPVFLISSALWGVYFALYSGTYDSIMYDTLLEESGHTKDFDRYFGRVRTVDSVALVLSSLAGGALANAFGLRTPYFVTAVLMLLSVVALVLFREPKLHKAEAPEPVFTQVSKTFAAVLRRRTVLPVMVMSILLSIMLYMLLEFSQVWLIELGTPTAIFGVVNAVILTSLGLGGLLAGWRQLGQGSLLTLVAAGLVICAFVMSLWQELAPVVASQVVFCTLIVAGSVVFTRLLHDQLPSSVRAGASSAVNTMSRLVIIPLALLFGWISREASVFQAAYLLVGFAAIAGGLILWRFVGRK